MQDETSIRILEIENNRRGDLFGRLMADLFVAIGYEQPRLNIQKSGRELDLTTKHRLEPRRAIAECKASSERAGGDDVNKFVGALDAERRGEMPISGYFISLSGFKETAVEQEAQGRRTRIVLLTGAQVVEELVKGNALVTRSRAIDVAARYCRADADVALDPVAELLAHQRGWIWAIFYSRGKVRTQFALIHADGTPLAQSIANDVIESDRACDGSLHTLRCLNPPPPPDLDDRARVRDALEAYGRYIAEECGFIQLDGLPADADVGARRLRLENLFVPLHVDVIGRRGDNEVAGENQERSTRQSIGSVLAEYPRLALLAAPGGGKSTLLKRLASAYADPARRHQVADDLPPHERLPLFFRCRELRDLARGSFAELLDALAQREPVRLHGDVFRRYVDQALVTGNVLLLVDGLDEISDPSNRAAFVCTLRTALQAYPGIAAVVTSREAGFRHVAAHLAWVCKHATISAFDPDDVRRLTVAWHREVAGATEKVRGEAEALATTIVRNDRIQRLAANPLLLTTLLLVKRWVGSLPTRRAVLYGKAVEVLLMTWNTEGHDPLANDEALPQLCFVAAAMMIAGVQKISRPRLAALVQQSRDALPTELGYVKGTVEEFIHRIEDRSSLLMMTGHDVEDGRLVEFYEFRHLTFQEFLTARAMVDGWHPGRHQSDTLATVLQPHVEDEKWLEVIPLAAVLGGKATEALIQMLLARTADGIQHRVGSASASTLGRCLADEAAARPETIRAALSELVRSRHWSHDDCVELLARGRYGTDFRAEARKAFIDEGLADATTARLLGRIVFAQTMLTVDPAGLSDTATRLDVLLSDDKPMARCEGALACAEFASFLRDIEYDGSGNQLRDAAEGLNRNLVSMLFSEQAYEQFAASFAFGRMGEEFGALPPAEPDVLGRLFSLWQEGAKLPSAVHAFALMSQPLAPRHDVRRFANVTRDDLAKLRADFDLLAQEYVFENYRAGQTAALIVGWYLRTPWSDSELRVLATRLCNEYTEVTNSRKLRSLLDQLDDFVE